MLLAWDNWGLPLKHKKRKFHFKASHQRVPNRSCVREAVYVAEQHSFLRLVFHKGRLRLRSYTVLPLGFRYKREVVQGGGRYEKRLHSSRVALYVLEYDVSEEASCKGNLRLNVLRVRLESETDGARAHVLGVD